MTANLAKNLEEHFRKNASAVPSDIKAEFCKVWPSVADGLKAVIEILKHIPGAGVAIPFIEAAIAIGNAIQKAIC